MNSRVHVQYFCDFALWHSTFILPRWPLAGPVCRHIIEQGLCAFIFIYANQLTSHMFHTVISDVHFSLDVRPVIELEKLGNVIDLALKWTCQFKPSKEKVLPNPRLHGMPPMKRSRKITCAPLWFSILLLLGLETPQEMSLEKFLVPARSYTLRVQPYSVKYASYCGACEPQLQHNCAHWPPLQNMLCGVIRR